MRPGDVLYVPAGLHHRCTHEGFSLHLGILLKHVSGQNVISEIARAARDDAVLNEPLRRYLEPDALADLAARIKARLLERVQEFDVVLWLETQWAAGARVTGLSLRPADLDVPGAVAALAMSSSPATVVGANVRIGPVVVGASPQMTALLAALEGGARPVAELLAAGLREPLEVLATKGVLRIV